MSTAEYVIVNDFPNYRMETKYPYRIYKIGNRCSPVRTGGSKASNVHEYTRNDGYITLHLDSKTVYKHIIVAKQFVDNPNPNKYTQVDHIDNDTSNFDISNLRWVSNQQNSNNKRGDITVKELPEAAIMVESYNGWEFKDLYYHDNTFYRDNGISYKIMKNQRKNTNSSYYIKAFDESGVQRSIYLSKFKREYDL